MTHHQSGRTLQQQRTSLPAAEVLASAKDFFARRSGIYAAFLEKQGPNWMSLRGQGGEEIVFAAVAVEGGASVRGSSLLFGQQVKRFFSTLPPAPNVRGAA